MLALLGLAIVFVLNSGFSYINAWGGGRAYDETKAIGGLAHAVTISALVMAASGFTWCLLVVATFAGMVIPLPIGPLDATGHHATMIVMTPEMAQVMFNLGYLVIIFPVVSSGLILTIQSWVQTYHTRSMLHGGIATYNTFAQVYNITQAIQYVPGAFASVGHAFGGLAKSQGGKQWVVWVAVIVTLCVTGGCALTYFIASRSRAQHTLARAAEFKLRLVHPQRHAA